MASRSSIEWTDATWNPVTGCSKVSPGCQHCYAESMAKRLQRMQPEGRYRNGFRVTLHDDELDLPLIWQKPKRIFVNSMSDLFHGSVSDEFIDRVFDVMRRAHWHTFQVLTKRPLRMLEYTQRRSVAKNVWLGTSIEDEKRAQERIDIIRGVHADIRFISAEPLIGPITTDIAVGLQWVIVGGESGPGARPIDPDWVRTIRDQCLSAGTPFFFKQWGGVHKKATGRILDDRTWDEMPK
ncbi:MAG TPA: phage Gp37/Gp68 family protein [Chlorobiota bacterium]|nr:phage Gp37/Gp68 family protein [Chlorobiota bacterium]